MGAIRLNSTVENLRPRLALRVGVTGHRELSKEVQRALAGHVRGTLDQVAAIALSVAKDPANGYTGDSPILRVISPLAAGADRLVAQAALEKDWELQCPLPFAREEYRQSFANEESATEFDRLIGHANTTAVIELDGSRDNKGAAYQASGRLVLDQCDILIAIWDGEESRGQGGTAQIVEEAALQEIPTIWFHTSPPYATKILCPVESDFTHVASTDEMGTLLGKALAKIVVHGADSGDKKASEAPDLFGDYSRAIPQGRSMLGTLWTRFLNLWSAGLTIRAAPELPVGPFRPYFDRVEQNARHFSAQDRGSFVANYLLGVVAVLSALLGSVHWFGVALELTAIISILILITLAKAHRWHDRAIDSRYLAEQLRQMLFLHPIGRVTPSSRPPAQNAHGDPRSTWMNWRFRALVRQIGMIGPTICFDETTLGNVQEEIQNRWLRSQVDYHLDNSQRLHTIEHRIHLTAKILFFMTIGSCLGHLIPGLSGTTLHWLTAFSAGLPACGAALHAIASHGEFRRLAERSGAMARQLELSLKDFEALAADPRGMRSTVLRQFASEVAQTMIDEVSDWRVIYRKPPLDPA